MLEVAGSRVAVVRPRVRARERVLKSILLVPLVDDGGNLMWMM